MRNESTLYKIWRVMYPIGIYFLTANVVSFIFALAAGIRLQARAVLEGGIPDPAGLQQELTKTLMDNSLMLTCVSALLVLPVICLLLKGDRKRETGGFSEKPALSVAWIVVFMPLFSVGVNNLISLSRLAELFPGVDRVNEALYSGGIALEILTAVIMAPLIEELLFRGLVFKRIYEYWGRMPALLLSSLFFGAYHMNMVQGVYAFILGLAFAWIYDRYKRLWAPVLAHMAANLTSVLMTETGCLDFLYANTFTVILSTAAELAVCVWVIWSMEKRLWVK